MIVSERNLANILFFFTINLSDNFNEIKDCSFVFSIYSLKTFSMFSNNYNRNYFIRIKKTNNKIDENYLIILSDSM